MSPDRDVLRNVVLCRKQRRHARRVRHRRRSPQQVELGLLVRWRRDYAARIGLGVAVEHALAWGVEAVEERVTCLAADLRTRLQAVDGVRVHDQGRRRCGIVTFSVDGVAASHVRRCLSGRGINTSVSLVDHARYDLPRRGPPDLVRASVHYCNTEDELDQLTEALSEAARS